MSQIKSFLEDILSDLPPCINPIHSFPVNHQLRQLMMVLVDTRGFPKCLEYTLDRYTHAHAPFSKTPKRQHDWFDLINLMCNSAGGCPAMQQENKETRKKKAPIYPNKNFYFY